MKGEHLSFHVNKILYKKSQYFFLQISSKLTKVNTNIGVLEIPIVIVRSFQTPYTWLGERKWIRIAPIVYDRCEKKILGINPICWIYAPLVSGPAKTRWGGA